ncbi:MAG: hypothetical protein WBW89_02275 [Candidatus Cybelea sp.]
MQSVVGGHPGLLIEPYTIEQRVGDGWVLAVIALRLAEVGLAFVPRPSNGRPRY